MKRFFLALLMLVLPLQAVLAAVETYHGHGAEHESAIEAVFTPTMGMITTPHITNQTITSSKIKTAMVITTIAMPTV